MATTFDVLKQRVSESINDWIEVIVTTAINADNLVVSTNLNEFDGGSDSAFVGWYCYITDKANAGTDRQVSAYATSTGQLTIRGAVFSDDSADLATIRLHRYSNTLVGKALNRAIEEVFPALHRKVDDTTLITGNSLPNAHFEDWASSSIPDFYGVSNATAAAITTPGLYRGRRGTTSALVTASGSNGYMFITSDDYPRLLDLMGLDVSFYSWAYPSTADDANIVIYTLQADGTTQTLTSVTTCPVNQFTLLGLEGQPLNDNLVEIQFRFKVVTSGQTCYFDDAMVSGRDLLEYLIPNNLQNGYINQVHKQPTGSSSDDTYDIHNRFWEREWFETIDDGTYKYLRMSVYPTNYRRLRLIGIAPLDALSSATDTINLDAGGRTETLVAYASYLLYEMTESPVSSEDTKRYERESAKRYAKYIRLLRRFRMISPSGTLKV